MKVLLGATAALVMMAAPALAQTTPPALPAQCNFTPAPTIPDGATATNNQMRDARTALEAWRDTRRAELTACQGAVQALQAQANAAATAFNTAAPETDAVITRFAAQNEVYNNRSGTNRRERGSSLTRPDH